MLSSQLFSIMPNIFETNLFLNIGVYADANFLTFFEWISKTIKMFNLTE